MKNIFKRGWGAWTARKSKGGYIKYDRKKQEITK